MGMSEAWQHADKEVMESEVSDVMESEVSDEEKDKQALREWCQWLMSECGYTSTQAHAWCGLPMNDTQRNDGSTYYVQG